MKSFQPAIFSCFLWLQEYTTTVTGSAKNTSGQAKCNRTVKTSKRHFVFISAKCLPNVCLKSQVLFLGTAERPTKLLYWLLRVFCAFIEDISVRVKLSTSTLRVEKLRPSASFSCVFSITSHQ